MGLDLTGIGAVATAAQKIVGAIFPDKTAIEQSQISAALALVQAQTTINTAEAASSDPLQHWRGGMGWVCVMGYFHNFIFQPLFTDVVAMLGKAVTLAPLEIGPLSTLTLGMLGLGGLHVAERIKGATG